MGFFKQFIGIISNKRDGRSYLDFASSTPLDGRMLRTFPTLSQEIIGANPSALHQEGVRAKNALAQTRALMARTLDAHTDEIVFTATATESDNLALLGSIEAFIAKGVTPAEIVLYRSDIEHAAVIESGDALADSGVLVKILSTTEGIVNPKDILVPLNTKVVVVSVMYVNNEIGTVQPIREIAKRIRFLRKHNPDIVILFHVDATQAPLHYALTVPQLGIDMMTLGATKLYCPKGVGMLYVRRGVTLAPLMFGGGQERGLRPGTESLPLIHAFVHAFSFAQKNLESYTKKITALQTYFEQELSSIGGVVLSVKDSPRSPHITHIGIPDFDSELMVLELDARGIAVSAKSACKNEESNESQIVTTLYGTNVGAIRFSFGRTTTKKDLDKAIAAIKNIFQKYSR
ncbi:cysteine desulfurase [Patescibacteria group bacterium]|nr:cysteine desulfurase [Patescibacteria group bacterium]